VELYLYSPISFHGVETDNFIFTLPLNQTEAFLVQTGLRTVTDNIELKNNSRVPVYQCGMHRSDLQGTCVSKLVSPSNCELVSNANVTLLNAQEALTADVRNRIVPG
jgi:hypothetical protein